MAGLQGIRADIAVRARERGWAIWIDGELAGAACEPDAIPQAVARLADVFAAMGRGARRMRDVVGSGCLFRAAGLVADLPVAAEAGAEPIGFLPYDGDAGGFGLGVAFGQTDAAGLRQLAAFSERYGDAGLRVTPWRSVIVTGIAVSDVAALREAAGAWISDPADPRRRIVACAGQPRCASAMVDARGDAARLAALTIPALFGRIHVSGCAKGCAHPGAAPVTLVGNHGRYDIIRNGRAGDPPAEAKLTLAQAAQMLANIP